MLTSDNIWIIGITKEPLTEDCYLVFHYDMQSVLDHIVHIINSVLWCDFSWINYNELDEIKKIGSGGYGTVYTAKCKDSLIPQLKGGSNQVVLRCANNINSLISEVNIFLVSVFKSVAI